MDTFAIRKALNHFGINEDDFMKVYNSFQYKSFSIEAFLFGEIEGIAHSTPDRLVKYVKDNELDIDTSLLEKCIVDRNREMEISDRICEIVCFYDAGDEDYVNELYLLRDEADALYDGIVNVMKDEVFRIKENINQLLK